MRSVKTSDHALQVLTVRGLKFLCRDGSSDPKALKEVVERNSYRRKDFELSGSTWVDLGANIGAFAVLAGSLGCRVTAYEPDPTSYELLCRNVELNHLGALVTPVNAAVVASKASSVELHVNSARGNYWRNSVVKRWQGGYTVEVPALHCDAVMAGATALKMDIEGSEFALLEHWLSRKRAAMPVRMVFEWSFDIDRSIPRFTAVANELRKRYAVVQYARFDESQPSWPATWFPPCRTVWCR